MRSAKWLCSMMIGLVVGCGFSKTLVFSQGDLQAKLVGAFPVEKEKYRLTIQLSDPEIKLVEGSDRVGFEMSAAVTYPEVKVLGKTLVDGGTVDGGRFGVMGNVIYDEEKKAFYLGEPDILRLDVPHLPKKYEGTVRKAVQEILEVVLKRMPIYRLKDKTMKQKATRLLLKEVRVVDGKLHLKVGVG